MAAEIVEYTLEHYWFLKDQFPRFSSSYFARTFGPKYFNASKDPVCVEMRADGDLIAVGICFCGEVALTAVAEFYDGFQKNIIAKCIEVYKTHYDVIQACVRASNYKSLRNFTDLGFVIVGHSFYKDGEVALHFELNTKTTTMPKDIEQLVVSYDIAKEMANRGFDEECIGIYTNGHFMTRIGSKNSKLGKLGEKLDKKVSEHITAPTVHQALTWIAANVEYASLDIRSLVKESCEFEMRRNLKIGE